MDIKWLRDIGLDTDTGIGFVGSEEKYLQTVFHFYSRYEKNKNNAAEFYASGDIANYKVIVHALKSNLKMLGDPDLAKSFEALEMASGAGDKASVDAGHAPAFERLAALIEKLKPIEAMGEEISASAVSTEEAKKLAQDVIDALDDFDDETAKDLARKLTGYPFRMTQRNRLMEAITLIDDFAYDDAIDAIKDIIPHID